MYSSESMTVNFTLLTAVPVLKKYYFAYLFLYYIFLENINVSNIQDQIICNNLSNVYTNVIYRLVLSQCKVYRTIFMLFIDATFVISRTSSISGLTLIDCCTFYKFHGRIQFWFNLRFTLHKMCELHLSRISSWSRVITTLQTFDCSNHSSDRKTSTCSWSWSSTTITSTVEPLYPIYLFLFRSTSFRFLDSLIDLLSLIDQTKCNIL